MTNTKPEQLQSPDGAAHDFPRAFYCPEKGAVMYDPVIGPTGESFERSTILSGFVAKNKLQASQFYPNRALKSVIEDTVALRNDAMRAGIRFIQQSLSHSLAHLLPEATENEKIFRPLNDAFYCPITWNLMHEPVTCPEGYTFEKVAIENWVKVNGNSPITRTPLRVCNLYPNNAMHTLLEEEKQKPEELMHPFVRKWKDEPTPKPADIELGGLEISNTSTEEGETPASSNSTTTSESNRVEKLHCKILLVMLTLFAIACSLLFVWHRQLLFCALVCIAFIAAISSKQMSALLE